MSWVVRAPDRALQREEKKTYSRVRRALWDYEPLRASHAEIVIDVQGTAVRLRGRVRTLPQKFIAAVLVARLKGISAVDNELIADPEVVRQVADALAHDARTAPYVIRIDSRHGIVMLRGEVPSEAVQQAAIDVASTVPSINSVRNAMVIGGDVYPELALARPSQRADELNPEAAITVGA